MIRRTTPVLFALVAAVVVVLVGCGGPPPPQEVELRSADAHDLFDTLQARTVRVLGTVTGAVSAEQAVSELETISGRYDDLLDLARGLAPESRAELSTKASRALPGLRDNAVRLSSMRGGEVLEPVLREIIAKVTLLE